ncbi:hypothetical protein TNCV_4841811 [Trichonephila clavipes]|uniref:Uncharacterized protein n=1 Tax=Trichonephila clavipes TaxID=2585209 RepID=A0A8X6WK80_TRICX|nr:hypothetical protein TNCV_4841811 [Trichonephila clavipes]
MGSGISRRNWKCFRFEWRVKHEKEQPKTIKENEIGLEFEGWVIFSKKVLVVQFYTRMCTSTCRNCGGGDRGRVAMYRPFGEFRRAKLYCHLYGAQGQRQAYLLPMPRSDYVRQARHIPPLKKHEKENPHTPRHSSTLQKTPRLFQTIILASRFACKL